jgi:hypothetical protein
MKHDGWTLASYVYRYSEFISMLYDVIKVMENSMISVRYICIQTVTVLLDVNILTSSVCIISSLST